MTKLKENTNNLSPNQQQSNIKDFIIGVVITLALTIPVIVFDAFVSPNDKEEHYNAKIDSLNHSIDSLENCINLIKPRIDTVYQQKTLIKYLYNEKADIIWNQSADDDWNYYTKFLSTRFPSDSCSTETN
jgi:hypothetical protein